MPARKKYPMMIKLYQQPLISISRNLEGLRSQIHTLRRLYFINLSIIKPFLKNNAISYYWP